jgi:hypothetical protein
MASPSSDKFDCGQSHVKTIKDARFCQDYFGGGLDGARENGS